VEDQKLSIDELKKLIQEIENNKNNLQWTRFLFIS
jgi:hypothetical protein